ncbi:Zinc finger protein [Pseudolycoriella hygida]|uniref:Zinc finger protein n=1 Tax=Pseudolycoriella hygida TaxID=35572 RepID=A0A9Q0MQA6_9DIPT|nr:Zinc finger protein [Pseudolycoriella hygida]
MSLTCINCSLRFHDANAHKDHYKTDWHRYNLKLKINGLPPVTSEEFSRRVLQQREAAKNIDEKAILYCNACHKQFNSEKSHANHLSSKKHMQGLEKLEPKTEVTVKKLVEPNEQQIAEEDDSDEWEDDDESPIACNECMFCGHESETLDDNLKHMSIDHSFFIPDAEYLCDIEGLVGYLADKITNDFICIWCNDRGRTFYSLDAVRKHMKDKGHCKMLHEGLALAEYAEFYDYSSSYPDHAEDMDIDEVVTPELLDGDEYQLVLPSGAVIGHRSLLRYYKQRLNPSRAVVSKSNKHLHKLLAEYRSIGWSSADQSAAAKRAKDIHHMKRQYQKWNMKLGVKANKLQRHFRIQNEVY